MRLTAIALVCVLLFYGAAYAQTDRGTITGTVTDQAGAMVPNAALEAKNLQTGAVFQAATSSTGNYTLAQLPVGQYQLTATLSGFKQFLQTGITVLVAQVLRIDIKLEVGNIQDQVTVNADAPLLKTESGELSHTTSTDYMNDVPMLTVSGGIRDAFASVNLIPGGGEVTMPGWGGTLRVNGAPGGTLGMAIEGQDATNTAWSGAWSISQPSIEAIQETTIQTSNYAAEYGQVGGGLFNMTVRSGTNKLHGGAYEYMRNETLFDAALPYLHETPRERRHDFGFTAGGPVYIPKMYDGRDKTFFFWSFEQNRVSQTRTSALTVPTEAYRKGDFSDPSLYTGDRIGTDALGRPIMNGAIYDPATIRTVTGTYGDYAGVPAIVADPFPGNKIPAGYALDRVALKIQDLIPHPTNDSSTSNYVTTYPATITNSIYALKMDHSLSSKLKVSGYWSLNSAYIPIRDALPYPITEEEDIGNTGHTARLNLDYTISPTQLLHLGGGFLGFEFINDQSFPPGSEKGFNALQEIGLPGTQYNQFPAFYGLNGANGSGMGVSAASGDNFGSNSFQRQFVQKPTGVATFNWVKGNHSYKFGGEIRVESYPSQVQSPANGAFYFDAAQTGLPYLQTTSLPDGSIGFPYASFLLGAVNRGETALPSNFHLGKHSFAFYVQDSWKATRKLTIDYGLRYDFQTAIRTDGRVPGFGFDTPNPAYGNLPGAVVFERNGAQFSSNYPYNFGPRLGIAYQITKKTVLRAGFGVSTAQTSLLEMNTLRWGSDVRWGPNPTYGKAASQLQNGPPIVPPALKWPDFNPGQAPFTAGAMFLNGFDRHGGYPPRQTMWSIGIQHELSRNLSLEASYVGNRGVWWNSDGSLSDPNRVTPAILAAHNFDPTLANLNDDFVLTQPLSSLSADQLAHYKLAPPYGGFEGTVSQALRPYPHFGGIFVQWAPLGNTWYDALQVKLTKRYSHGVELNANYTFQKELTVGSETQDTAFTIFPAVINLNDLRLNKTLSGLSIPHRLVISGTYTTPKVNVYKPLSVLMKDWRIGFLLTYQSGTPIPAPQALNNLNPATTLSLCEPMSAPMQSCNGLLGLFGIPSVGYMSRVPGVSLYTQDINSHYDPNTTFILNEAAWATPPDGKFPTGSPYYNDYRYRRTPTENISLERIFRFKESATLSVRVELYNAFNRTFIPTPFNQLVFPQVKLPDGTAAAGFGYSEGFMNASGQRTGQLVARFNF